MDYMTFNRHEWQQLKPRLHISTTLAIEETQAIYKPLADFLHLVIQHRKNSNTDIARFFHQAMTPSPFIIGIAGSVAAGKSTTAKILADLLSSYLDHPKTAILSTDHFLYPNRVLEERGIMNKKGFPESYDYNHLHHVLEKLKGGVGKVDVPVYSHVTYDILPEPETIERPDILFVEGINVLQVNTGNVPISDSLDITLYVDAEEDHLFQWYWERIRSLVKKAKHDSHSYFTQFTDMDDVALFAMARRVWEDINLRNLHDHILPTRERADIIIKKGAHHIVDTIRISNRLI